MGFANEKKRKHKVLPEASNHITVFIYLLAL